MLATLTQALGTLITHAGRLLRSALLPLLGLCLAGTAINAISLLLVGMQSWSTLGAPLVVALLSLPAYLFVGWKAGIGAALDEAWRTLGAPLREEVAIRVVAQLGERGEQASRKLGALADTVAEVRTRLADQRWLVRTLVELLLARVPWAQALDPQVLQQRLAGASEPAALQRVVREQLDRIELPAPLAWLPFALVGLHVIAMTACIWYSRA